MANPEKDYLTPEGKNPNAKYFELTNKIKENYYEILELWEELNKIYPKDARKLGPSGPR